MHTILNEHSTAGFLLKFRTGEYGADHVNFHRAWLCSIEGIADVISATEALCDKVEDLITENLIDPNDTVIWFDREEEWDCVGISELVSGRTLFFLSFARSSNRVVIVDDILAVGENMMYDTWNEAKTQLKGNHNV